MPTEQQDFNERSRDNGISTPKPDPTDLTREAVAALRALLDQRISATEALFAQQIASGTQGGLALKELFTAQLEDLKQYIELLTSTRAELLQEKFEGRDKALVAALAAADKAVEKSNLATEKRFDGVNELLGQQTTAIAALIPRAEAEVRITGLSGQVDAMQRIIDKGFSVSDTRQATDAQSRNDSRANIAIMVAAIAAVAAVMLTIVTMMHVTH
jgi:hypothetical protein